jgi:hypothetical protein
MDQSYMEILFEEMRGKFDLVLEGHATLRAEIQEFRHESNEKHDLTAFKLQVLSDEVNNLRDKVDAIATDLATHRADTEAHPRYLVRE